MVEEGDDIAYRAQSRLETDGFTPTTEFYAELLRINREATELRLDTAETNLGLMGFRARRRLAILEEEYIELYRQLVSAQMAAETGEPYRFECVEQGFKSKGQNEYFSKEDTIIKQLSGSFDELARTRELLTARQSEAVSRINISVSTLILAVSACTLIASLALG